MFKGKQLTTWQNCTKKRAIPRERTCQVREQLTQLQKQPTSDNCMSQPITMKDIEAAIKQLKCKKAPGPDGVTNDMIKHLGPAAKKTLLELLNKSWKNGTVPALWKKPPSSQSIKKAKTRKTQNSFRPISLLSCLGKLLERVINRRLLSFLEERKILSPTQTGYRKQKHRRSADPHCPRDRECLSRKEKGCVRFL